MGRERLLERFEHLEWMGRLADAGLDRS